MDPLRTRPVLALEALAADKVLALCADRGV